MKNFLLAILISLTSFVLARAQSFRAERADGSQLLAFNAGYQVQQDDNVVIYPNPVKTELNISFPLKGEHTVKIYNIIGEKITEQTVYDDDHIRFNLSDFQTGVYFISYEQHGKIVTKTFSKAN